MSAGRNGKVTLTVEFPTAVNWPVGQCCSHRDLGQIAYLGNVGWSITTDPRKPGIGYSPRCTRCVVIDVGHGVL